MEKVLKLILVGFLLMAGATWASGQFMDSTSGLLQMPSAEMYPDGTVTVTGVFMNKHTVSDAMWGYHTFGHGYAFTLWSRIEIAYVMTHIYGKYRPNPTYRDMIMINQDRHFAAKVLLLREGEFGIPWMPAVAVGVSDPTTGGAAGDYSDQQVSGSGNGFFNRNYIVATKHFQTPIGMLGAHLGYQFNRRTDIHYNGPCAAIVVQPVVLQKNGVVSTKIIAEYNARTFNVGVITSFWQDHIEAMVELQALKWISAGLRYKVVLK